MSLTECQISGGQELYIIGKNFLKDSKVIFKTDNWCKIVEADKEFLHSVSTSFLITIVIASSLHTDSNYKSDALTKLN